MTDRPAINSALYTGHVVHRRLGALAHGFRYPIYLHLIDLDELALLSRSRLFGYNRPRPVTFRDGDYLGDPDRPVAENIRRFLGERGVGAPIARVLLLTQCRVFGYVFNPVSFFYCFDRDGGVVAIVAEVHNTFGERHPYLLAGDGRQFARKVFHVSPFFTLDGRYRFQIGLPEERLTVRIDLLEGERLKLATRLTLDRRPWSTASLAWLLAAQPLMPLRVIGGIHWQAVRLWWKGAQYQPKPPYDPAAIESEGVATR